MRLILNRKIAYIIFAIVFFLFWFLFKVGGMPHIIQALQSTFIDIAVTMSSLVMTVEVLLPKFFYKYRYKAFFVFFAILIFVAGSVIILAQLKLEGSSLSAYHQNVAKSKIHFFYWFWADLVFGSYFLVFFLSATGALIRFAFDRLQAMKRIGELEKFKTAAELEALKNQINPHFLFNALNTIYYKIDRSNTSARNILQSFSEMLRYQLYECEKDFANIECELQFLKSYIELQKARLNDNYEVIYNGFDKVEKFHIAPFLLMPLIENCFKHVSGYDDEPNRIVIEVKRENNFFLLHTFNTMQGRPAHAPSGIGMTNVKRRLGVLYEDKYSLDINSSEKSFEVNLKLELS